MTSLPSAPRGFSDTSKFRTISLQEAIGFGVGLFISHILLWVAAGLLMGVVHHLLMTFLGLNGGRVTLAERLLESLLLSAWALAFSVEVATQEQDGGNPNLGHIFKIRHLFSATFCLLCLCFLSLGGAFLLVQIAAWIFPGVIEPLGHVLLGPVSVSVGWSLLPLLSVGGMLLGVFYSLGPFAVLREGSGFLGALERSRFLTREIRLDIFFLQGFLFITLCGAFYVFNLIPNPPTFLKHILESLVIAGTASLTGTVWTHAYRQAVALDEDTALVSLQRGRRIHILDEPFLTDKIKKSDP